MAINLKETAEVFRALSDQTRLQILQILQTRSCAVNEIVDFFSLSQPTISRHLEALAACGLIDFEKRGQQKIYKLNEEGFFNKLADYLGRFECFSALLSSRKTRG